MARILLSLIFGLLVVFSNGEFGGDYENDEYDGGELTNSWAMELNTDDEATAREIAKLHGFKYEGRIRGLPNHFHMSREESSWDKGDSKRGEITYPLLQEHPKVKYHERLRTLSLEKRGLKPIQMPKRTVVDFNDPKLPRQWYIESRGDVDGIYKDTDMRVKKAWQKGYMGDGILVAVMDDGLDHHNEDLKRNFDLAHSANLNGKSNGDLTGRDPVPRNEADQFHGTKCAGEIAATANNNFCGVGIAPNVKIAGIRMLDGSVTGKTEGEAFIHNCKDVKAFSASWGPRDNGMTVAGPSRLGLKALEHGITNCRNGLGSIYVWASGNGGQHYDDCSADGYVSHIGTIAVGSVTPEGLSTYYDETCSPTLAVVYSGDPSGSRSKLDGVHPMVTTGMGNSCVNHFGGTSAAAPLAAGIFALTLQANPNLTWRDLQHLVVRTSRRINEKEKHWRRNAAGFYFNDKFGYGLLDADKLTDEAVKWKTVPEQKRCVVKGSIPLSRRSIGSNQKLVLKVKTNGCLGTKNYVKKLEHVQAHITMSKRIRNRGALSVDLTSSGGTISHLFKPRPLDMSRKGLDWPFMSTQFWGEDPAKGDGEWTLVVHDNAASVRQIRRKRYRIFKRSLSPESADEAVLDDDAEPLGYRDRDAAPFDNRAQDAPYSEYDELFRPYVSLDEDEEVTDGDYRRVLEDEGGEEEDYHGQTEVKEWHLILWGTSE